MKRMRMIITLLLLSAWLSACGIQPEQPLTDVEMTETAAEETETEASEFTEETTDFSDEETADVSEETEQDTEDTTEEIETSDNIENEAALTMQDIIAANEISTLLTHYDTVLCEMVLDEFEQTVYADNDILCYMWGNDSHEGVIDGRRCALNHGREYLTYFELGVPDPMQDERCLTLNRFLSGAKITETTEENGLLYVTAELSERDSAYMLFTADLEVQRGDIAVMQYTLRAEDRSITEYSIRIQHADGTSDQFGELTMTYNTERPAAANMLFEHMTLPDTRTITVIVNPNSDAEYTLSTVGIQGDRIQFYSYNDSGYDIRTDNYQDTDRTADIVIYGFDKDKIDEFYDNN